MQPSQININFSYQWTQQYLNKKERKKILVDAKLTWGAPSCSPCREHICVWGWGGTLLKTAALPIDPERGPGHPENEEGERKRKISEYIMMQYKREE